MALFAIFTTITVLMVPGTVGTVGFTYPDCVNGPLKANTVCNTKASPAVRAAAVVAAMQNSEKLANLYNEAPGISRLGLSSYNWWSEALHGVAYSPGTSFDGSFSSATQFPEAITMAAAFDDAAILQVGTVIGTEARAFGNNGHAGLDFWTPNVNPYKDPRWGRGHETPGEEPLVLSRYVKAFVAGMQGNESTHLVLPTCKHFAGYDQEETRYSFNAQISIQDLAEYYLPPFQACTRDAKAASVMCSYNAVNGVPSCANSYLLETILRQHWGWTDDNQYIVSDCGAVSNIYNAHDYTTSYQAAVAAAFNAGTDNICDGTADSTPANAFNAGSFSQATLDKMMVRQYQALIRAGYFDGPSSTYRNLGSGDVNSASAQSLALQIAQEGVVVLKNDGFLPNTFTNGTGVAMIGFWADTGNEMLGGYSGGAPYTNSPVYAAKKLGLQVNYATGPIAQNGTDTWTSAAVAAAQGSSSIIFFAGIDNTIELEQVDRTTLSWPAPQLALVQKLASLGKPIVIVKMGTHIDDTPLLNTPNIRAIVWAGYPGQDGGTAVMNVLTGAFAASGRLPITMYPSNYVNQVSKFDMTLRPSSSNPGRTYRWFNTPVFPFGHGLSYTKWRLSFGSFPSSFSIQELMAKCTGTFPDLCRFQDIPITVANTGSRSSDFVALAFVSGNYGPRPYPIKTLATYQRLFKIPAGQSQSAKLSLTFGDLGRVDSTGSRILYPGAYSILLDQPTAATLSFTLTGSQVVLDDWPQPGSTTGNPPKSN